MSQLVVEGDQVGQEGPVFCEPMMAGPDPQVVFHMPGRHTEDEQLHNLPRHRGQGDRPVVPQILFSTFLVDRCYSYI